MCVYSIVLARKITKYVSDAKDNFIWSNIILLHCLELLVDLCKSQGSDFISKDMNICFLNWKIYYIVIVSFHIYEMSWNVGTQSG